MNFLIEDCNREKLSQLSTFIKEMNGLMSLVSHADGPAFSEKDVVFDHEKVCFEKQENEYSANFNGSIQNNKIVKASFKIRFKERFLAVLNYSINDNLPVVMQVELNGDGELIIKKELERSFERSIFFESEQFIDGKDDLEDSVEKFSTVLEEEPIKAEEFQAKEEKESMTILVTHLSERVLHAINEAELILNEFDAICHDLTRGRVGEFKSKPTETETLENGATVEFVDYFNNDYKVIFRKGMLESNVEISFFLEVEHQLIFSVYIANDGTCRVTTAGKNAEATAVFVKNYLER